MRQIQINTRNRYVNMGQKHGLKWDYIFNMKNFDFMKQGEEVMLQVYFEY